MAAIQKSSREVDGADEFVTALSIANEQNIPVILGDAPQNSTLRSIQDIFSLDTFNPKSVVEGSLSLVSII